MAADPDPYYSLPMLYGAPAYARPPRPVDDGERPFDPDDLPIAAERTDEERALLDALQRSGASGPPDEPGTGGDAPRSGAAGRRLSIRALSARLGSRPR